MKKSYSEIPDYKERQYVPRNGVSAYEAVALCLLCLVLGIIIGAVAAHADDDVDDTPVAVAGQFASTQNPKASRGDKASLKSAAQPPTRIYPDKTLTPGVTRPVTMNELCTPNSTKAARNVTEAMKKEVFERYGFVKGKYKPGDYEIDHFISLELGGSNDIKNLWPQPYAGEWGARKKDVVETALHRCICNAQLSVEQAQHIIVTDWVAQYKRIKADHECDLK